MALKDIEYQNEAVKDLLTELDDSWDDYERSRVQVAEDKRHEPRRFGVYLSALTGAGKTVIVGRVIAELLTRPESVVLWLSDSPSLNEQTRYKLVDLIDESRMRSIDKVGVNDRMEPGYVYFLNRQKLDSRAAGSKGEQDMLARWRLLADAMRDPTIRLYVIQDEAHRGVVKSTQAKTDPVVTSIVEATATHLDGVDPIPVILGVTATPKKFMEAMKAAGRGTDRGHTVPPEKIQESGLIKRTIDFTTPHETGTRDKNNLEAQLGMLDQAVAALKRSDEGWGKFHAQESKKDGYAEQRVVPLLLMQVQDGITDDELGEWYLRLNDAWQRHFGHILPKGAVAHVLQEHKTINAQDFELPYCPPQDVQATTHIRVLLAKLAVSTGWDCPRAEVLFSLRGGEEETYIAQLIGRMVRMPLAERSLSAELDHLNVARVLLPYFTYETVVRVVEGLKTGEIPTPGEPDMIDVAENPAILADHGHAPFDLVSTLTKAPAPSSAANPVVLMTQLAVMVATDGIPGIAPNPRKTSLARVFQVLDDYVVANRADFNKSMASLDRTSETRTVFQNWATSTGPSSSTESVELDVPGRKAKVDRLIRAIPGGIGPEYVKHLRARGVNLDLTTEQAPKPGGVPSLADHMRWGTLDALDSGKGGKVGMNASAARDQAAALAQFEDAMTALMDEAKDQCREWLVEVEKALEADAVKPAGEQEFLESRRNEYRKRIAQFGDPVPTVVGVLGPRVVSFGTEEKPFTHWWPKHLLTPVDGDHAEKFFLDVSPTSWEKRVLDHETAKDEVVAWYRNPGTGNEHTLQVPWRDSKGWHSHHPDFVFIEKVGDELRPSVVDPHDPDRDGLARLRGMAAFVQAYGDEYERFWSVGNTSSGSSSLRRLDLKEASVRAAIMSDDADVHELYADPGVQYP